MSRADLAVGLGVGLGVDGDDAGPPLLHRHHQRVLPTAGWLVAASCVILWYNPWYYPQFCISIFYIELEMTIRKAIHFQVSRLT